MSWDQNTMMFGMMFDGIEVLRAVHEHRRWAFNAHNIGGVKVDKKTTVVKRQIVANFAVTDGVEDINTGDVYIWDGDLDDVESDSEESQRAECDEKSVRDDSNVEMQSAAASADDLNEAEQELWDDMQLWDDILRNSSLPDYDDAYETQEGVDAEAVRIEDYAASTRAQAESEVGDDADRESDDELDDEFGDAVELAGGSSHGSDLSPISEETESELEEDDAYDYLFGPNDAHEAQCDSGTRGDGGSEPPAPAKNHALAIPSQMLIGKVHPRDEEVRRTHDKKRTKVKLAEVTRRPGLREVTKNNKLKRFEDYDVYSAFKALHADRRGKVDYVQVISIYLRTTAK
ncbi:Copia type Polyprotein [Phytophthora megakarya]|uniref:Copia type Polyprotein n=1 Tax=Phytophthora megakarya TaxID=4795 RepID=A0A225WUV6_9STRA|nr:Copia type Polyprotein [Phytophthora megakarya]